MADKDPYQQLSESMGFMNSQVVPEILKKQTNLKEVELLLAAAPPATAAELADKTGAIAEIRIVTQDVKRLPGRINQTPGTAMQALATVLATGFNSQPRGTGMGSQFRKPRCLAIQMRQHPFGLRRWGQRGAILHRKGGEQSL